MKRGNFQRLVAGLVVGTVLAAFAMVLAPVQGAEAATVIVVNDAATPGDCGSFSATQVNISDAMTAMPLSGGTILVCPGIQPAFAVNKLFNSLTIKAAIPGEYTMPVILPPPSGGGSIIEINNQKKITLDGLFITGSGFGVTLTSNAVGVAFNNSSGTLQNSVINSVMDQTTFGSSYGYGITVSSFDGGKSIVTIKNNVIRNVDYTLIEVTGPSKATISDNYMLANSDDPTVIGSYGINFNNGAAGSLSGNTLSQVYVGLSLGGANKVTASKNTISYSTYAISLFADCSTMGFRQTNGNKITGNVLFNVDVGVNISSDATGGCTPHVDSNTISGNFMGSDANSGNGVVLIEIGAASVAKNKITGNTIASFVVAYDPGGTTTNTFSGNKVPP